MAPISEAALVSTRPGGQVEPVTVACGLCGCVLNEIGVCASRPGEAWHVVPVRCKPAIAAGRGAT